MIMLMGVLAELEEVKCKRGWEDFCARDEGAKRHYLIFAPWLKF